MSDRDNPQQPGPVLDESKHREFSLVWQVAIVTAIECIALWFLPWVVIAIMFLASSAYFGCRFRKYEGSTSKTVPPTQLNLPLDKPNP